MLSAGARFPRLQGHKRPFSASQIPVRKVAAQALKLYTNPGSRGKIPEWYLAELALPYETVLLDMRAGEHKQPAYLAVNPFGKVPGMEDDDLKLFESGAILLHLASKYGKLSGNELSRAMQWTLFANSTLTEAFFGRGNMDAMLGQLDVMMAKTKYLEGDKFTVGDIAVGAYLLYLPLFFPDRFQPGGFADKYPNVWRYMLDISAREPCPATYKDALAEAQKAMGAGGSNPLAGLFGRKK